VRKAILAAVMSAATACPVAACSAVGNWIEPSAAPPKAGQTLAGAAARARQASRAGREALDRGAVAGRRARPGRRLAEIAAAEAALCGLPPGAAPSSVRSALASSRYHGPIGTAATGYTARPVAGRWAGKLPAYLPTSRHVVALTFDAGANDAAVPPILRTLRRFHVPATFFMTGHFAQYYPKVARRIAADGYLVGNHTATHTAMTQLSAGEVRWEIVSAAEEITKVTGARPAPLFRFPYGADNSRLIAAANKLGFVTVAWTVDTLGWEGASAGITVHEVISRVLAGLRPGEIVLMHVGSSPDGSTLDARALPQVIRKLKARGYSFVTLDVLAG
jgi:peptidoglycan/xylan/chitin deacetylase (PgdA/CDA1 family)